MLIEVIVCSVEDAILAQEYGADRLELIHSFAQGGLSPNRQLITAVCAAVTLPVNVMLRPHGCSFVYSAREMAQIEAEIDYLVVNTQANGVVYGSLTAAGEIDFNQLEQIIGYLSSSNLELTFHRAIDASNDVVKSFAALQGYGTVVTRVLSSGGYPSATAGSKQLSQMRQLQRKNGAILLAGSGITPVNARQLIQQTAVAEIHLGTGLRRNGVLAKDLFAQLITVLKG